MYALAAIRDKTKQIITLANFIISACLTLSALMLFFTPSSYHIIDALNAFYS
jgi:hypothetical protein